MTLEHLLTSKKAFNLPSATPLQRAITRAAEGLPTQLPPDDVRQYFGSEPTMRPDLVVLVCGVRSGKTLIAGCAALHSALQADLSSLLSHERARVPIVAPTVQNATDSFRLLQGAILSSPTLKALVVGDPKDDTITIRRADGRFVDIVVVAAHRGAVTLRGTWLAGFVLEETASFGATASGYVVNAEELLVAAETRLVPGGQGWIISSPMGPEGVLFNLWKTHFGAPGKVLVVHAPTLAMNSRKLGGVVDESTIEDVRRRDPDGAAREYDAAWADASAALIPAAHIDAASTRKALEIPYVEGQDYAAAMDPATRGNAWTLVVATRHLETPKQQVVLARQWVGSKQHPLSPRSVLREIAVILQVFGLDSAATDQHAADANKDIADSVGLYLYDISATQQENVELFESMRTKFADGEIELPPDPYVRQDLLGIRKIVSSRISMKLLKTPDGRHCDYAPALARVLSMGLSDPKAVLPKQGTPEWIEYVRATEKQQAKMEAAKRTRALDAEFVKHIKRGEWHQVKRGLQ